ncbi:Uma2 family endonuclease [Candidatus Poribacteria bacterium]|nr:Uma2 family endonuclease [Candidatus Poribacteria bacterium]
MEKIKEKLSYEEFLDWCDEDTLAEWVDGEIIMYSPASLRHQDLTDFLISILRIYTEAKGLGVMLSAPFQMKLPEHLPGREPDLIFVSTANLHRLQKTYLDGPADLAIEIISEESIDRDRGRKFVEYEASGVQEYWLIDPLRSQAEFYRLGADNRYHVVLPDAEGIYHSEVLSGFWLRVSWFWQTPLPPTVRILAEIAGVPQELVEAFEQALGGGRRKKG